VLPLDLIDYLRSDEAQPLLSGEDLERYVSSLKSARSTQPWLHDAIRDVGQLRKAVREIPPRIAFGSEDARMAAERIQEILSRIERYEDPTQPNSRLRPQVERFRRLLTELAPPSGTAPDEKPLPPTTEEQVKTWTASAQQCVDAMHQELRLMRRASAFASP